MSMPEIIYIIESMIDKAKEEAEDEYVTKIEELQEQLETLQEDLDNANEEIEDLETENSELEEQVERLKKTINLFLMSNKLDALL